MFVKVMRDGTEAFYECTQLRVKEKAGGVEFVMEGWAKTIVLFVAREEKICNVYVMNADGKTIERYNLTQHKTEAAA